MSFMAGDGRFVAYSRTLMTCNLPVNAAGITADTQCLLVGTVKGLPVVAATTQMQATAGKLFMVEMIDSGHARFSGSLANIVEIELRDTTLAALMTVEQHGYPLSQCTGVDTQSPNEFLHDQSCQFSAGDESSSWESRQEQWR